MIVVIDGPAGAGKSSTAKAVARKSGFNYIDTGAMYRGFTALFLKCHKNSTLFFEEITKERVQFEFEKDVSNVFLDGENITDEIRTSRINDNVSEVAAMSPVRAEVLVFLKRIVDEGKEAYIAEGRDLGTVVFPYADLKIFLTADIDIRAKRRLSEMSEKDVNVDKVKENLLSRDEKDSTRQEAPLLKADDAIELDTTNLSFDEQVDVILDKINKLLK